MYFNQVSRGQLMVAEPYLLDPNFRRSVILLTGHSKEEGTVGFILNKPLKMDMSTLLADFPDFEGTVFYGGPVATDTIHFIHTAGDILDGSIVVDDGLYWGGDYEKLKFLIEKEVINTRDIKFFVGYSGWDYDQLKGEMIRGSWFVADNHKNYVFQSDPKKLWRQVLQNKGDRYSVIAQMPDQFILN